MSEFLKPYRKELVFGPIFKMLEACIEIIIPFIIARMIDNSEKLYQSDMLKYILLLFFLAISGFLFATISQYFAARTSQGYGTTLRNKFFSHIFELSHKQVSDLGPTAIVNRVTTDINNLEFAIAMFIRLILRVPFICIGSIVMIYIINKNLAIIILISILVLLMCIFIIFKVATYFQKKQNKKLDNLLLRVKENLINLKIVRSFNATKKEEDKFKIENDKLKLLAYKSNVIANLINPISIIILDMAIVLVLKYSNIYINNGELTTGKLIAVINYISQMITAIMVLSSLVVIFSKAFVSNKRVLEILNMNSNINYGDLKKFDNLKNAIEFNNVSFSYNGESNVLNEINLKIKKGEIVGVIGFTGSGKTTLLSLINRTQDINSWNINIFGRCIKEYNKEFLKENVKFISQKSAFFTNTIKENVLLGRKENNEKFIEVLYKSDSEEFISKFENKEETILENNACNLSGGQKQRVALARAFTNIPQILILDDVLSALDAKTERKVLKNIKEFAKINNITLIISSQKTNSLNICDKIVVLDKGKIENIGTKEELIEKSSVYKEIYNLQNNLN